MHYPSCLSSLLSTVVSTALLIVAPSATAADAFPSKPVRLIVPFSAGGGTDILARDVAPRLAEALGQPVVVDNRGGAGGNIGSEAVARAEPDGYTILFGSNTLAINASLYKNLSFDPQKSFAPIGMVASAPLVLVTNAKLPIKSVQDLIAQARAQPGKLNWSAPGSGTPHHLASEIFNRMTDVDITHIQYKGGGPAINDLLGGHTQVSILTLSSVKPFIEEGRLRALGVATPERSALMPDLPTIAQAGVPGYHVELWYGLFAPAGTPEPVVAALNTALNKTLADPALVQRFQDQGYEPRQSSPAQLAEQLAQDVAQSAKAIQEAHITVN